ncbi:uncharacterized protein LOC117182745 [Belonocnema kinseyi]|uniref:uncharacterized protein LOC117182745 n=1 Tax=Belonocnema kinseyi TaxID=2817044 RepID=UPI00143D06F2|nr:uncharacterized protein LOC117182745 [Belonocnema kinseyi]
MGGNSLTLLSHNRLSLHDLLCFTAFMNFFIVAINTQAVIEDHSDTQGKSLSRQKRYLTFSEGSNLQLVYCLTIGAYGRPGDLVLGMTAALAYELPTKVDQKLKKLLHRKSRSVLFPKIESFLQSTGLDGKSCVMRALCEAGQRSESEIGQGTFVQELLHAIFTLPNDGTSFESIEHRIYDYAYQRNEDCTKLYPTCKHSIYEVVI